MKKLMIFALFLTVACDAPKQTRYPTSSTYDSVTGSGSFYGDSTTGSITDQTDDSFDSTDGDSVTSNAGFENCNIGHRYSGGSIGYFGLCQSSQDERVFATSFAESDLSDGTCFVPMYIDGGVSHNVGRAECVHNQANKTYYPILYKNQNKEINAVMIIKYSSINSFMQCMNAKSDYINGHPGCIYNQTCVNQAQQYASTVCTSFVNNHGSHYKQVAF